MSFSTKFNDYTSPLDHDLSTLSNYHDVRTTHIDLLWAINWNTQLISGTAHLTLEATNDITEVILDTSYLDIDKVEVDGSEVKWDSGEKVAEVIGSPLKIRLDKGIKKGDNLEVKITYSTTEKCTAVGWLTPLSVSYIDTPAI